MALLVTLAVGFPLEWTVQCCHRYSGMGQQRLDGNYVGKLVLGRKQIHVQACLEV